MKYGNLKFGPLNFEQDKIALKVLLEKGELEQAKYDKMIRNLNHESLLWIAKTNGYTGPKKQPKKTMAEVAKEAESEEARKKQLNV